MTVVSDSSPLVILSKLGCFELVNRIFTHVFISSEVHHEGTHMLGRDLSFAGEVID